MKGRSESADMLKLSPQIGKLSNGGGGADQW